MHHRTVNVVGVLLQECRTLWDAEDKLAALPGPKLSKATIWGLWDGYNGRPASLAGLGKPMTREVEADYAEGMEIGRELSLRGVVA